MELVRGTPITRYCLEHEVNLPGRLALFIRVCKAVQHAHQKGIIHRDLKPSNILVTTLEGEAAPKIIDFGIARATQQESTERTVFTQFHHFLGTPAYMSPEQAGLNGVDIDTRSDIYSLGALLYELLTGQPPFEGKALLASGLDEFRRTIRETEPIRPSIRLREQNAKDPTSPIMNRKSQVDPDLDWIVMKCLEKDRNRRYETANGLAQDLERHLANQPVLARPPGKMYRFNRLIRRHRTASVATGLVLAAVLAGGCVSGWALIRERKAHRLASERLRVAMSFADRVLAEVAPEFNGVLGTARAHQRLGQASLDFVQSMAALPGGEAPLQETLTRALVYLSSAQNPGGGNTLGDFESGLKQAQEAVALLSSNVAHLPEAKRLKLLHQAQVAAINCWYGMGRWEEGIQHSVAVEPVLDQLERFPEQVQFARRERYNARCNAAYALLLSGHVAEAIRRIHEFLAGDFAQGLSDESPAEQLEVLANMLTNLATAEGLRGEFGSMTKHARDAVRIWELLVQRAPNTSAYRLERIEGRANLGWAMVGSGHAKEGFDLLQQSREEAQSLVALEPANDPFRNTRAVTAATCALAFAAADQASGSKPLGHLGGASRAEQALAEAERLCQGVKTREAAARLELARKRFAEIGAGNVPPARDASVPDTVP
jgi:tetratricopeptide (TPR) repeat protein